MTVPWSLTTTLTARVDTVIDTAEDREAAQTAALAEALDAIHAARISESPQAPRYELRAAGDLVALIQTGTDESGRPDHAATAALIQRIETARGLSASPY